MAPKPWEYVLGVGVAWNSNVAFLRPDGLDSTAVLPSAAFARILSGPRGQLRVSAAGRWDGYPAQDILSRFYFGAGLRGDYRVSTHGRLEGDLRYDLGYSDSSPVLIEQGVSLPLVKTRTLDGELGLTQQMGSRTSLRISGRVFHTEFEAPGLIGGSSLRATVSLQRKVAARDTTAVVYALEGVLSSASQSSSYLTHFGSFQWSHALTDRTAVLFEAGGGYTPEASQAGLGRSGSFYGGVTLARRIGRSTPDRLLPPGGGPCLRPWREPPGRSCGGAGRRADGTSLEAAIGRVPHTTQGSGGSRPRLFAQH